MVLAIVVQIARTTVENITILLILMSRHHMIDIAPSGVCSITGGKWTTYRRMAQDVVDEISSNLPELGQMNVQQNQ